MTVYKRAMGEQFHGHPGLIAKAILSAAFVLHRKKGTVARKEVGLDHGGG